MASLSEALGISFDYYAAGRFAEAAALCRRILDVAPDQAAAAQVAGAALAGLGRRAEAAAAFRRLLMLRPADGGGWSNLGNVAGEDGAALAAFGRALACDPWLADACANRAALLTGMERKGEAAAAARAALVRAPDHDRAMVNLADSHIKISDDSLLWARRACRLVPRSAAAWLTLAAACGAAGLAARSADAARIALALDPASGAALENLALAQAKTGVQAAVDAALARAAVLTGGAGPGLARSAVSAYLALAQPETALNWLDVALRAAPHDAGLHWNRATALLQAGRWDEGWREFEWRRRDDRAQPPWRNLGVPMWDGGPFSGRRLLLYAEQGLGDAVQMLRFLPLVLARGGDVVLEVQPPLLAAARRVFSMAQVISRGDPLPPFDLERPLMSLPGVLGVLPDRMPGAVGFLPADPVRAAAWAARLGRTGARALRIGLVWAGNPRFPDDRRRSPGLAALTPLLRSAPQARFFALQMGEGRGELAGASLPDNFHDLGQDIADIDDTLAIMAGLDLVISSCTLPAHLAAAAGTPLWLLLSASPDWRWLLGRGDTPWHAGARLFRQTAPGDWSGPVGEMIRALSEWAADERA